MAADRDGESGESTFKSETLIEDLATGGGAENSTDRPQKARGRPTGSKSRRTISKSTPGAKPEVPQWFIDHSVTLREDSIVDPTKRKLGVAPVKPTAVERSLSGEKVEASASEDGAAEEDPSDEDVDRLLEELEEQKKHQYWLDETVWKEIQAHVQAGLMLPKATFLDSFAAMKSNCLLHFPKEGGIYCLDAVVESVAADAGADLVRIDAQDLEEIAGDFLGDSRQCRFTSFAGTSFDTYSIAKC